MNVSNVNTFPEFLKGRDQLLKSYNQKIFFNSKQTNKTPSEVIDYSQNIKDIISGVLNNKQLGESYLDSSNNSNSLSEININLHFNNTFYNTNNSYFQNESLNNNQNENNKNNNLNLRIAKIFEGKENVNTKNINLNAEINNNNRFSTLYSKIHLYIFFL